MKKHLAVGVGLVGFLCPSVAAQTLSIDHQPVGCAAAQKFARLEARFAPAESVATARVLFQGQSSDWYSVAMKLEGPAFVGILPKPKQSLKTFRYYIEVTGKALGTNRTAEYTTAVVDSSSACKGKLMSGALGSASVVLQGPAGAAALPAGFASTGVVTGSAAGSTAGSSAGAVGVAGAAGAAAAGGGLSTGALVGIVAGAGAAAAGVAVAAGKGGENSSTAAAPTPTPGPSSTTYTGPFSAQMVIQFTNTGGPGGCQTTTSTHNGTLTITLQQSSGSTTVGGNVSVTGTRIVVANTGNCAGPGNVVGDTIGISWALPVTGSPGNLMFSGVAVANSISFSGALNGGVITGTLTLSVSLSLPQGDQAGTVSVPVTLR